MLGTKDEMKDEMNITMKVNEEYNSNRQWFGTVMVVVVRWEGEHLSQTAAVALAAPKAARF